VLAGERLQTVTAGSSGVISQVAEDRNNFAYFQIGSDKKKYKIHASVPKFFRNNQAVSVGQPLARGIVRSGDHLFVNRIRYNFVRPQRGEIVVFRTKGIQGLNQDDYYIKRLVGMPGEKIQISETGWLMADGTQVKEPKSFDVSFRERFVVRGKDPRMHIDEANGFITVLTPSVRGVGRHLVRLDNGPYVREAGLSSPDDRVALTDRQYLFFGDNTTSSQDGRYFGGVDRENLTGTASLVMWPFLGRAQLIDWSR
jgi:signal peptidase I